MKVLNELKLQTVDVHSTNDNEKSQNLSEELRRNLSKLVCKHSDEKDGVVNYTTLGNSIEYKNFTMFSEQLNFCDPDTFDRNEKLSFYLNIYNVLTIHALVDYQTEYTNIKIVSVLDIPDFWQRFCYKIGPYCFSLDEIEHGLLRANERHPSSGKIMFGEDDPRKKLMLPSLDPRIHFTLNCGAKSCPMVRVYSPHNIDQKLDLVTTSYLVQEIQVERNLDKIKVLYLPQLFDWYGADFAHDLKGILRWMTKYLDDTLKQAVNEILEGGNCEARIKFTYDWSMNTINH